MFAGGDYDGDKAHIFWDGELVESVSQDKRPKFPADVPKSERKDTRVVVGSGVDEATRLDLLIDSFVQKLPLQPMIGRLATTLDEVGALVSLVAYVLL